MDPPPDRIKSATLEHLALVIAQLALLAALLLSPGYGHLAWLAPARSLGLLLGAAGLVLAGVAAWQLRAGRSLTPMPTPRAAAVLQTRGLYRQVRHPVYSGLLVWACGVAIAAASVLHFLLFGMLWVVLAAKAKREEQLLNHKFSGYAEYAARTPRFFPTPRRHPSS